MDDQAKKELLEKYVDEHWNEIVKAMRPRGSFRTSKPKKNGLHAFLWRMVRFDSGIDPRMPMTCFWDLEDFCQEELGFRIKISPFIDDKQCYEYLMSRVDKLVITLNLDPFGGAKAWGRAFGAI